MGYISAELLYYVNDTWLGGTVSFTSNGADFTADASSVTYGTDNTTLSTPKYTWYVDGEQQDTDGNTFTATKTDKGKIIRVMVTDSEGKHKGAVYAEKIYPLDLIISGKVSLIWSEDTDTFVADISGTLFGTDSPGDLNGHTPIYTWYIDNNGDGNFDKENPIHGPSTEAEGGKTLSLIPQYLDCTIRVEVRASPLKGFVSAERLYTEDPELYISGMVSLSGIDTFVADISKTLFGTDTPGDLNGHTPSYTWYKDNKGDGKFDETNPVKGPLTEAEGGKILPIDDYLGCNIRVKVTAPPLRGAVYAEKLVNYIILDLAEGNPASNPYNGVYWDYANDVYTIKRPAHIIVRGSTNTRSIKIAPSITANITLENASIDQSNSLPGQTYGLPALFIGDDDGAGTYDGVTLNLTLTGSNTLKSGSGWAGLGCNDGATLVIDGEGSLHATGGNGGAGIGGWQQGTGGDITIESGLVEATGGLYGAGIGGGRRGGGGKITIKGGTVSAIGKGGSNNGGAGIGGGSRGNGGDITIEGGLVRAIGGDSAAAIGGGDIGAGGNITIRGDAVVYAYAYTTYELATAAIGGGLSKGTGTPVANTGTGTIRIGVDDDEKPGGNPTVVAIIDTNQDDSDLPNDGSDTNHDGYYIPTWPGIGAGGWVGEPGSITIGSGTIISNGIIGRTFADNETTALNPTSVTITGGVQIVSNIKTDGLDVTLDQCQGVQVLRERGTPTAIANARVDPIFAPTAPWQPNDGHGTTFPSGTITLTGGGDITGVSAFTLPAGWTLSGGYTVTGTNVNLTPSPITWPDGTTTP